MLERAGAAGAVPGPEAEAARQRRQRLAELWVQLQEAAARRQQLLDVTFQVQQFCFDAAEVEAWLGEQELLLMDDEKGKVRDARRGSRGVAPGAPADPRARLRQDEQSTLQLLKKHLMLEQTIENYEETITQLSRQCRALLELGHPDR